MQFTEQLWSTWIGIHFCPVTPWIETMRLKCWLSALVACFLISIEIWQFILLGDMYKKNATISTQFIVSECKHPQTKGQREHFNRRLMGFFNTMYLSSQPKQNCINVNKLHCRWLREGSISFQILELYFYCALPSMKNSFLKADKGSLSGWTLTWKLVKASEFSGATLGNRDFLSELHLLDVLSTSHVIIRY